MLRNLLFVCVLCVLPAIASAQPRAQDWEISLGGGGNNNRGFTEATFAVNGSIGYFFSPQLELSFRQGVTYADQNNGTVWQGNSRVALDYHFTNAFGKLVPYVGGNVGYAYGDNFNDTWEAAPEAGLKYYVHDAHVPVCQRRVSVLLPQRRIGRRRLQARAVCLHAGRGLQSALMLKACESDFNPAGPFNRPGSFYCAIWAEAAWAFPCIRPRCRRQ